MGSWMPLKKTKRLAKSGYCSPHSMRLAANAPCISWSNMSKIMLRLRIARLLRRARNQRQTVRLLELLIEQHPLEADVLGMGAGAYTGLPEQWLYRNARGTVRMVVIGG